MRDVKWAVVRAWAERRIEECRDVLEATYAPPDFVRGEIASLRALLALQDKQLSSDARNIQASDIAAQFEQPSDIIEY